MRYIKGVNFLILFLLVFLSGSSFNQGLLYGQINPLPNNAEINNNIEFFEGDAVFEMTLIFDITEYLKNISSDKYTNAILKYSNGNSDSLTTNIKLKPRGIRRKELCPFPPIRLNFNKSGLGFVDIDSIGNVKLVTHCRNGAAYQNYVLKEYLAYKLFNIISDTSYRVRLVKVNYIDTGKKNISSTNIGFLIEPDEVMERRFDVTKLEDIIVRPQFADIDAMDRMALFNLMIGNVDYQLETLHNVKTFKPNNIYQQLTIVFPYDFDYSGMVNSHYAVPAEGLGIENVTQRLYLGPCRDAGRYNKMVNEFLSHKEEIMNEINNFQHLEHSERRKVRQFINEFFRMCEDGSIIKKLRGECIDYR